MATQTTIDLTFPQREGAYVWQPKDKNFRIEIELGAVDGLVVAIMRGFGAVPRKGVEVGGILLGSSSGVARPVVRIDGFEPFPCQHRRGPTFELTPDELQAFRQTVERWQRRADQPRHAVGFYRSHLREGLCLSEMDLAMYDAFFPEALDVALIVKPFATKPSIAGFFIREQDAVRSESSYLEFPFRRRELSEQITQTFEAPQIAAPSERLAPAPRHETKPGDGTGRLGALRDQIAPSKEATLPSVAPPASLAPEPPTPREISQAPEWKAGLPSFEPVPAAPTMEPPLRAEAQPILRRYGLAAAGLVAGLIGGIALTNWGPPALRFAGAEPYALKLSAGVEGGLLQVRWDRKAAPIRQARSGTLTIDDSGKVSQVKLTTEELRNGSVTYQHSSPNVTLRLDISAGENRSLSERAEARLPAQ